MYFNRRVLLLLACIGPPAQLQAAWATWTTVPTTPIAGAQGSFLGNMDPRYNGTIVASFTQLPSTYSAQPIISAATETDVTPTYMANFGALNGAQLPYLRYDGAGVLFPLRMNLDFSQLGAGYLPAGSLLGFISIEDYDSVFGLTALDANLAPIATPWFQVLPGSAGRLDLTGQDHSASSLFLGDQFSQTPKYPRLITSPSSYELRSSADVRFDTPLVVYRTLVDMRGLLASNTVSTFTSGEGWNGIAIATNTPEPAPAGLMGAALVCLGLWRRKARKPRHQAATRP